MALDLTFQNNTLILKGVLNNQTISQELFALHRKQIVTSDTFTKHLSLIHI